MTIMTTIVTDENFSFYKRMNLKDFKHFAHLTGFDTGVDIDILFPYLKDVKELVELGAGYGRAIHFLLDRGYKGKITAVDRVGRFLELLKEKYGERINTLHQDIRNLKLTHPVDGIMWLWSGISELSHKEQEQSVQNIYKNLSEGGMFILESPYKKIKIVGEHKSPQHITLTTDWGRLDAYLPNEEEIQRYAESAGFASLETLHYQSETGLDRIFYILRK
ncbi:MAG: class I SAM-dependent methyltransferase [Flammeovirgaceae bacterium]